MSFMSKLTKLKAENPPRILIYGPPGMGKTSLAIEFPGTYFILAEDGLPSGVEVDGMKPKTYEEIMTRIGELYSDEHPFKTLVIDSLDKMEPLLWDAVCRENNWQNIETPGYGKGYVATSYLWRDLLEAVNALRLDRGMNIVFVCHSDVERFDDPTSVSYSQYQVRLHKTGRKLVEDEVDAIFLVKQEASVKEEKQGFDKKRAIADGGTQRFIFCEGRPAFTAKNRFGMPAKILFRAGQGYAELAKYLPAQPELDPPAAPAVQRAARTNVQTDAEPATNAA